MSVDVAAKRAEFRRLHQSGCFVIPNPWDVGSAKYLQQLGFKALASTSSGFAWSVGQADMAVGCEGVLAHLAAISAAVDVPVNADFEGGYAATADGVGANVARAVATGVSGLSIEDSTGEANAPLYPLNEAVRRMAAARKAIDTAGGGVLLTGRAENFLVGRPDLADTIARLQAYAQAGADCLYAPGLQSPEQIAAVVKAVAPKPVNFLIFGTELTVGQLADLGVRRISVGGALARTAWGEFMRVSQEIMTEGSFGGFARGASGRELNGMFGGK